MKLRFLTWNISFAYGPGSDGGPHPDLSPYRQKPSSHFETALKSMGDFIRESEVDVAFLQEVDFNSRRSHYQNQLDLLARTTGLQYRLPIISWNHPYIPYPGLNPLHHFGKVVSGGGVISRFPIRKIQHDFLPKPKENSNLYNFFYLQRYLQIFKLILPELELNCANLHLEAFSEENRKLHLIRLQDRLIDYDLALTAGDFNGSASLSESHSNRWDLLMSPRPSFPLLNQVLDGWIVHKTKVSIRELHTPDTGILSDHLPVLLEVECSIEH